MSPEQLAVLRRLIGAVRTATPLPGEMRTPDTRDLRNALVTLTTAVSLLLDAFDAPAEGEPG